MEKFAEQALSRSANRAGNVLPGVWRKAFSRERFHVPLRTIDAVMIRWY